MEIKGHNTKETVELDQKINLTAKAGPSGGTYQWSIPGTAGTDYELIGGSTLTDKAVKFKFLTPGLNKAVNVTYTYGGVSATAKRKEGESLVDDLAVFDIIALELIATDLSTAGDNNVRQAHSGETLYMVREAVNQPQSAEIEAIAETDFKSGEPIWTGNTSGQDGDTKIEYSGIKGTTITATAWDYSNSVDIAILEQKKKPFPLIPSQKTLEAVIGKFNTEVSFGPKATFKAKAYFKPLADYWIVEKPNSPETTHSYSGGVKFGGSLEGKIKHPTLSGEFPPDWAPGEPVAKWEVYAKAAIKLTGDASAAYLNEYVPIEWDFDGKAELAGTLTAGVSAEAKGFGCTITGDASAAITAGYETEVAGDYPNRRIEGNWFIEPLTLSARLALLNRDEEEIAAHNFSEEIYQKWTQSPKTVLLGQPLNPK